MSVVFYKDSLLVLFTQPTAPAVLTRLAYTTANITKPHSSTQPINCGTRRHISSWSQGGGFGYVHMIHLYLTFFCDFFSFSFWSLFRIFILFSFFLWCARRCAILCSYTVGAAVVSCWMKKMMMMYDEGELCTLYTMCVGCDINHGKSPTPFSFASRFPVFHLSFSFLLFTFHLFPLSWRTIRQRSSNALMSTVQAKGSSFEVAFILFTETGLYEIAGNVGDAVSLMGVRL